jgi:hypothetical protein
MRKRKQESGQRVIRHKVQATSEATTDQRRSAKKHIDGGSNGRLEGGITHLPISNEWLIVMERRLSLRMGSMCSIAGLLVMDAVFAQR